MQSSPQAFSPIHGFWFLQCVSFTTPAESISRIVVLDTVSKERAGLSEQYCVKSMTTESVVEFARRPVPKQNPVHHANPHESLVVHWVVTERSWLYLRGLHSNWISVCMASKATLSHRFARIALDPAEFNFTIKHKREEKLVANTLSKLPTNVVALVIVHTEDSKLKSTQLQDRELILIMKTLTKQQNTLTKSNMFLTKDYTLKDQILLHKLETAKKSSSLHYCLHYAV